MRKHGSCNLRLFMTDAYEQVDDLAATHTNAAIAAQTGLAESTVSRYLRGLMPNAGKAGRPRDNPRAFERGRQWWAAGMATGELIEKLPASRRTVYRWIQRWRNEAEL